MLPEDLINSDILKTALYIDLSSDVEILSWTCVDCGKTGENFFNVVKRVIVQYVYNGEEIEATYVAKLNPCKDDDMFNAYRQRAMEKEIFFYHTLLPLLNCELVAKGVDELSVPKYIYSCLVPEKEVIILEDLDLKGFKTFPRSNPMDGDHTILMVKEICKLHVAGLLLHKLVGDRDLSDIYPLLVESWNVGKVDLKEAFETVFKKGLNFNLQLANNLEDYSYIIPWLKDLSKGGMGALLKELESTSPWRMLCHGDFHRTNVLFRYDEWNVPQEVKIIDWQTIRMANPSSELGYLLYSSYSGNNRQQYFPLILKTYLETFSTLSSELFFSIEELEQEIWSNNFGLLLCFYLVPLSLSVSCPSELFLVDNDAKLNDEAQTVNATNILKENPNLKTIFLNYLSEINRKGFWTKTA